MGKIVASYLVKVHLHGPGADADGGDAGDGLVEAPTNDVVKQAIVDGVSKELSAEVTVSLIERTDD